jgi:hypothetical protein
LRASLIATHGGVNVGSIFIREFSYLFSLECCVRVEARYIATAIRASPLLLEYDREDSLGPAGIQKHMVQRPPASRPISK